MRAQLRTLLLRVRRLISVQSSDGLGSWASAFHNGEAFFCTCLLSLCFCIPNPQKIYHVWAWSTSSPMLTRSVYNLHVGVGIIESCGVAHPSWLGTSPEVNIERSIPAWWVMFPVFARQFVTIYSAQKITSSRS